MTENELTVLIAVLGCYTFVVLLYLRSIFRLIDTLQEKDHNLWVRLGSPAFKREAIETLGPFSFFFSIIKLSGWFLLGGRGATNEDTSKAARITRRYLISCLVCLFIIIILLISIGTGE